ncbi:unnamed protein product [Laminaria digitata]
MYVMYTAQVSVVRIYQYLEDVTAGSCATSCDITRIGVVSKQHRRHPTNSFVGVEVSFGSYCMQQHSYVIHLIVHQDTKTLREGRQATVSPPPPQKYIYMIYIH